jgi:hypothetical protein
MELRGKEEGGYKHQSQLRSSLEVRRGGREGGRGGKGERRALAGS